MAKITVKQTVKHGKNEIIWLQDDVIHRDENEGPALIWDDGTKKFFRFGHLHRGNDKPAIEYANGDKEWWVNGEKHREGGKPAVIFINGWREYWEEGRFIKKGYTIISRIMKFLRRDLF